MDFENYHLLFAGPLNWRLLWFKALSRVGLATFLQRSPSCCQAARVRVYTRYFSLQADLGLSAPSPVYTDLRHFGGQGCLYTMSLSSLTYGFNVRVERSAPDDPEEYRNRHAMIWGFTSLLFTLDVIVVLYRCYHRIRIQRRFWLDDVAIFFALVRSA